MKKVIFNNNVLRDGHQSLAATRMTTEQMLPVCEDLDAIGFGALETWGGATIDSGLRFLDEFPFDRLDALKKACPKTPHMMLLRGQNIVQYAHFPDEVVTAFINMSAKHGMDIFRIFDALNDPRNMLTAIEAAKAAGKQAHGTICYTTSPVHTTEKFIELGCQLEEMGCDAIVLKDMAGLIPPMHAQAIIKGLKKQINIPVWIHTHDTAGLGATTYLAAVDAGVDAIDCSVVPFANGTGQPDTVRMLALLKEHERCPDFSTEDIERLGRVRAHLNGVYKQLSEFTSHTNEIVDSDTLLYQVPGGMLSNFRTQLAQQKMEDKFDEVFAEIPVVREALGWIPLVTPTSQIVGMQAFLNVKFGRWKQISPQAADIALGYYGVTPAPVNPEIQKLAAKQAGKDPITCRPVEAPGSNHTMMADLRKQLQDANIPDDDEHCVIQAMFPQQLATHYKNKNKPKSEQPAAAPAAPAQPAPAQPAAAKAESGNARQYALTINGKRMEVAVEEL
ncbi:pyruvate carboxylase subunit B [Cerasicoccus fimbriatus]|uniref:pyruvate carboxylase subunit B n=1 Tax=Cerasicoccus fimbriatus TaxID=3014554 RepID=UPI0022B48AC1|nr:pyruvate carboxylase subunit B [Cerasicoccus sp. TK19100]